MKRALVVLVSLVATGFIGSLSYLWILRPQQAQTVVVPWNDSFVGRDARPRRRRRSTCR